jgi:transposase
VRKAIEEKAPEQLKLPFALWNREAIAAFIQQKYDLKMSLRTLTDYLRRWDYTPQKPTRQAIEQKQKH